MKRILSLIIITVICISIVSCSKFTESNENTGYALLIDGSQLQTDRAKELELLVNQYEETNNIELLPEILRIFYLDGGSDREAIEYEYKYYKDFFDNIFTSEYLQNYYGNEGSGYNEHINSYLLGCYFLGYDWYSEIIMFQKQCEQKYYMVIEVCQFIFKACEYMSTEEIDKCLDIISNYEKIYVEYENTECYLYIYGTKRYIYEYRGETDLYEYYYEKWNNTREAIINVHE